MQNPVKQEQTEPTLARDLMVSRKIVNNLIVPHVHYHKEHELYYMLEGSTTYFIDGEIYSINKGDFVFISHGISHRTDYQKNSHNERIVISFEDSVFSEKSSFVLEELTKARVIHIPQTHLSKLEELLFKIESEYRMNEKGSSVLLNLYILELLTLLCRYRHERKNTVYGSEQIIHKISEYIRNNFGHELTLKSLSQEFFISEGHLSRKFKQVTGLGINQYMTYVRISQAEKQLIDSDLTVTEIAELCGFCGSTYFSSVFRKSKGITPLAFRKTYQK